MGWSDFPRRTPIPVRGGIQVRSQRGKFGSTWWGKRWIEVLEGFGWTARLERGRRYARSGQVMDFRLSQGEVEAKVQGARPQPYRVRIALAPLSERAWKLVTAALASRAAFTAQLLAGEMPAEVEEAFTAAKAHLFPDSDREFKAECNCPDWANPCKHIAALHYVLGEAFDRDPFLLFALRGRPRETLLADLRNSRSRVAGKPSPPLRTRAAARAARPKLPTDPVAFWGPAGGPSARRALGERAKVPHALLRTLGTPAFLRGREDLQARLEGVYDVVSARALLAAKGGPEGTPRPGRPKGRRPVPN